MSAAVILLMPVVGIFSGPYEIHRVAFKDIKVERIQGKKDPDAVYEILKVRFENDKLSLFGFEVYVIQCYRLYFRSTEYFTDVINFNHNIHFYLYYLFIHS